MRILGIDYGDRHIGLALSDPLLITAQPLGVLRAHAAARTRTARIFRELVAKHDIGEIVVGNPLRMDGSSGTRTDKTRLFAAWLEKAVGRPVVLMDERLTTQQALKTLDDVKLRGKKKKDWEDRIAAVIILSTYLERKRGERRCSRRRLGPSSWPRSSLIPAATGWLVRELSDAAAGAAARARPLRGREGLERPRRHRPPEPGGPRPRTPSP